MQSFPGDLLEDQAEPAQVSGVWGSGSVDRFTCVRGLSKHPGSFHRDVAFSTRADLAEFDCREAFKLRDCRVLPPFSERIRDT